MSTDKIAATGNTPLTAAKQGTTVRTTIERGDAYLSPQLYNVEITLLETLRGKAAQQRAQSQNIIDKPPQDGWDYFLAYVRLGYFRRARGLEDEPYTLTEGQFAAFSSDGSTEYEIPPLLKQPQPSLIGATFSPGETKEGWVLLQAPQSEKKPLLAYKRKHVEGAYGIWQAIWYQLF